MSVPSPRAPEVPADRPEPLAATARIGRALAVVHLLPEQGHHVLGLHVALPDPWRRVRSGEAVGVRLELDAEHPLRVVDLRAQDRVEPFDGSGVATGIVLGARAGSWLTVRAQVPGPTGWEPAIEGRLLLVPGRPRVPAQRGRPRRCG